MPLFTDINELKRIFDIDLGDKSEDAKLAFYSEWAGNIIEEYLDRKVFLATTTEYYNGTGTQKLLLRRRPVWPSPAPPGSPITVVVDEQGLYGTAPGSFNVANTGQPLTYGVDYTLNLDQPNGSSRSAILYRVNDFWPRPCVRQPGFLSAFVWDDMGSIKVTYTAGFTVDQLPAAFRAAGDMLVAGLRYIFPLGQPLGGDGYEERSVSMVQERKNWLMAMVKPLLHSHRNWKF